LDKEGPSVNPHECSREGPFTTGSMILLMKETLANPDFRGVDSGVCRINQVALVIDKSVAYSTFGDDVFGIRWIVLELLA